MDSILCANMPEKHRIVRVVDIDGTLLEKVSPEYYLSAKAFPKAVQTVNQWYEKGDYIVLWTARSDFLRKFTINQLAREGIKYHELHMNKPYTHNMHIYDDNNITFHRIDRKVGLDEDLL